MRIGAVVSSDGDTIVPLPDGPEVVIADTDSRSILRRLPNPARSVSQGRRAVVTRLFADEGVEAVCSVPATFCEHSHELARRRGLRFLPMDSGTRLSQVLADPQPYLARQVEELASGMLFLHT